VDLPNTATTAPAIGLAAALVGLALVARGTRRVRMASAQLVSQSAALARLVPLLRAAAHLQHSTAVQAARAEAQSRQMIEHMQLASQPETLPVEDGAANG
jgi:hypothetical protein